MNKTYLLGAIMLIAVSTSVGCALLFPSTWKPNQAAEDCDHRTKALKNEIVRVRASKQQLPTNVSGRWSCGAADGSYRNQFMDLSQSGSRVDGTSGPAEKHDAVAGGVEHGDLLISGQGIWGARYKIDGNALVGTVVGWDESTASCVDSKETCTRLR